MHRRNIFTLAVLLMLGGASSAVTFQGGTPIRPAGHQKPDHMDRHFDNAEQWAREFDDPARSEWQMPSRVIDTLGLKTGQSIADIGAGTGYFSSRLARSSALPRVYAVDIEASMVAYLKARAAKEGLKNLVAVQAGADGPNLPGSRGHHPHRRYLSPHPEPRRGHHEAEERAQARGTLAIVDFRKDSPSGPPVEFRFTPEQIGELARAGYSLTRRARDSFHVSCSSSTRSSERRRHSRGSAGGARTPGHPGRAARAGVFAL